jgi:asparagine synthetase B (glutamine-hydrolysing)
LTRCPDGSSLMCGITGFYDFRQTQDSTALRAQALKMTDTIF